MVKSVKYKRPRKINPVSVALIVTAILLVYLGYQYVPMLLRESEATRVLMEATSQFAGRKSRFLKNAQNLEVLRRQTESELRRIGITDPDMETWIEIDSKHAIRFGVAYAEIVEWPYDIIGPQYEVFEVEVDLELK